MQKKKAPWMGWHKNLIILLLLVSTLILVWSTGLFHDIIFPNYAQESYQNTQTNTDTTQGSYPFFIAITTADGMRYGAKYDLTAVRQIYDQFSAILGEALGSAKKTEAVTLVQWEQALSQVGIYFDFLFDLPLSVIADGLGMRQTETSLEHTSRRFCVVQEEGGISLYFLTSANTAYRCQTMGPYDIAQGITEFISNHPQNEITFAFEQPEALPGLDPYFLLSDQTPVYYGLTAMNALRNLEKPEVYFSLFDINSTIVMETKRGDGSSVYREGERELRISPSGEMRFTSHVDTGSNVILHPTEASRIASHIVTNTLEKHAGSALLTLSRLSYDKQTNTYYIEFQYIVNGMLVFLSNGAPAAQITLKGNVLSDVRLFFRSYTASSETMTEAPDYIMAKHALDSESTEGPVLVYEDNFENITARWAKIESIRFYG